MSKQHRANAVGGVGDGMAMHGLRRDCIGEELGVAVRVHEGGVEPEEGGIHEVFLVELDELLATSTSHNHMNRDARRVSSLLRTHKCDERMKITIIVMSRRAKQRRCCSNCYHTFAPLSQRAIFYTDPV